MLNTRRFPLALFALFLVPSLFAIPLSSSPSPSILRSVHVSCLVSLSLSLSQRDIPTPAIPDPAALARGPREINSPSLPFPSPSSSRPAKVADVRRRLHLHCHYESAHVARGMSFLLRAPVWLYHLRPCVRMRAWEGANVDCIIAARKREKGTRKMSRNDIRAKDPRLLSRALSFARFPFTSFHLAVFLLATSPANCHECAPVRCLLTFYAVSL